MGRAQVEARVPVPSLPLREFRGTWIATVRGVDWPREPYDPVERQQKELLSMVEMAHDLKLNALIFQVRPAGDAVYLSDLEPWSPWLTNEMGKAPIPFWDPLAFLIEAAHARGIEVHAWFNPFRALAGPRFKASANHVTRKYPQYCWRYGDSTWMDPGRPQIRAHSLAVFLDVLKRYDVDGLHMDDYFYPYPIKENGQTKPFPDQATYRDYLSTGGKLSLSDWRRENIDHFVESLYRESKKIKPWVRIGISPFGIWRPNNPEGIAKGALDPYESLGADSLKWLQQGWCDYFVPQLYWPMEPANLSFGKLFDWWVVQNKARRHIWPGMAGDRILKDRQASEILKQLSYTRARAAYMPPGHVHWSISPLMKNLGQLRTLCRERAYQDYALPPAASWLGSEKPAIPLIKLENGEVHWRYADTRMLQSVKWWVVQTFEKEHWKTVKILPKTESKFKIDGKPLGVAVRAISLTGVAGEVGLLR